MKDSIAPTAAPDAFAQTLAVFREAGMTAEVSETELRELHALLAGVLDAVDAATDHLAALAGPSPGPIPQHLRTMMLMGAGYFRHAETALRVLFRARNAARRAKCPPAKTGTQADISP